MIGIDEVGRGSWAGPLLVVAARQILSLPDWVCDSKTLTKNQRNDIFGQLNKFLEFGEGWVRAEEIDELGLATAMRIGVCRALLQLGALYEEEIIIDGSVNYCPVEYKNTSAVVRADSSYPVVGAASIYAKVLRDRHMERLARFYPYYGFEKHVGYGTALHKSALRVHGISSLHRKSFRPISELLVES